MAVMPRDEFSLPIKDALAKRVGLRCSNPNCGCATAGPHSEPSRSVNLGVASHITAAASGGPRFDTQLSSEERSSIDNGIWLCQKCAKLIDSDTDLFSAGRLRAWKVEAEAKALRDLGGTSPSQFLPQSAAAVHAPIPRMGGLSYDDARAQLLEAGWQPRFRHWSHGDRAGAHWGNGAYFWAKGYRELINACPTGLAQCKFGFHDVYGNLLTVVTTGEVIEEYNATARVCNWYFVNEGDVDSAAAGRYAL